MNCNIIKDLIPLCIDGCCSKESEEAVFEHTENCTECRKIFEDMKSFSVTESVPETSAVFRRIYEWKASLLQSALLFLSFGIIIAGVTLEAETDGISNGFWAVNLIIPATGFFLSLANWYFLRIYRSRKIFSNCSFSATLCATFAAYCWSVIHYETFLFEFFGIVFAAVFCVLSKILSDRYARMLGKE